VTIDVVTRYVIRGGQPGLDRLQVLARAHARNTADLLDMVGLRPGVRAVDLGCGAGHVSLELARRVGSSGHVLGIDMDEVNVAGARSAAVAAGLGNVEFRVANVADWRAAADLDFAYCRLLLEHLPRPIELLAAMWTALRAGGAIAVEDADFEGLFCYPANEGFATYARTYAEVLERHGGDSRLGRKLARLFLEAGIPAPNVRLVQRVNRDGEPKLLPLLTLDATSERIAASGIATRDELDSARASLATFLADPTTIVGGPRIFQVWARKP
jgi:ubiquinone/menaquinone biosynthesis C-methylase UbiE